ncbi:MAG: DUF2877 domain-containing protein [Thermoanaerobacteraceae bacterium]|nr:DUF2877 domain-containing protein [Thermoanaerobacteraceae bacterium]
MIRSSSISVRIARDRDLTGTIHSVFERAANIDFGEMMISLLNPVIGNNPYGIVLDVPRDFSLLGLGLYPGQRVWYSDLRISIAGVPEEIDTGSAALWDGSLKTGAMNIETGFIQKNTAVLKDGLKEYAAYGLASIPFPAGASDNLYVAYMRPRLNTFLCRLKALDEYGLKDVLGEMVGFGPGLTPSADDFLTGFIGAIHLLSSEKYLDLLKSAVMHNIKRTTRISSIMLASAAEGEFPEFLKDLMIGLASNGDRECLSELLERELNTGATSGADTAAGLISGLEFFIKEVLDEEGNS